MINGNYFVKYPGILHKCIEGGDAIIASIATASIIAKTHRDALMVEMHKEYPQYGWDSNKGYGTLFHRNAITGHGLSPYHRRTFSPVSDYIQMEMFEGMAEI